MNQINFFVKIVYQCFHNLTSDDLYTFLYTTYSFNFAGKKWPLLVSSFLKWNTNIGAANIKINKNHYLMMTVYNIWNMKTENIFGQSYVVVWVSPSALPP